MAPSPGQSSTVGRIPRLNLGSGRVRIQGWVNVDVLGGDVRAVGEALPFRNAVFEYVLASHVLEHVDDLGKTVREIHRVLKRGGILQVFVPYGLRALYDPFHRRPFDLTTMDYFCRPDSSLDAGALFHMVKKAITSHSYPFKYELRRFLKIRDLPIGRPYEIGFTLERL